MNIPALILLAIGTLILIAWEGMDAWKNSTQDRDGTEP